MVEVIPYWVVIYGNLSSWFFFIIDLYILENDFKRKNAFQIWLKKDNSACIEGIVDQVSLIFYLVFSLISCSLPLVQLLHVALHKFLLIFKGDFFLFFFSVSELFVDNPTENDRLDVKLNITLPRMKCEREYFGLSPNIF